MKKDITTIKDVQLLVDSFYEKVRKDDLLKNIFNTVIQDKWPQHLNKMYKFWQTILLGEHTYTGTPFMPHAHLPVSIAHFERWLELFHGTVNEYFEGQTAQRAIWQSERMATIFHSKIEYIKQEAQFR